MTVSDGQDATTRTINITVLNVNAPPEFELLDGFEVQEGQLLRFSFFAFDPDNLGFVPAERDFEGNVVDYEGVPATVSYAFPDLPDGAVADDQTTFFEWIPNFDQAGDFLVTFEATDDGDGTGVNQTSTISVPITVRNTNRPPVIAPIDNVTVQRGDALDVAVAATDAEGNPIVLAAINALQGFDLPAFITFDDHGDGTGVLHLAPSFGDRGDHLVKFIASDDGDVAGGGGPATIGRDEFTFVITVESFNEPPIIALVGDKVAIVGQSLSFDVVVSDMDEDALTFEAINLPTGATLTPTSVYGVATFAWTPVTADLTGSPYSITLRVTDSGSGEPAEVVSDEQTIAIVVRESNAAPVLLPVGDRVVDEFETLTITLSAVDADGDPLTYAVSGAPLSSTFNATAGVFSWTPDLFDAGDVGPVVFTVSDGAGSSSESISITVDNVNQAPTLIPLALQSGRENTLLQFTLVASDVDGGLLTFSVQAGLPQGASFSPATGQFLWTPNFEQAGDYLISFGVEDIQGATDSADVTIQIADVNRAPTLNVDNHKVALGELLNFILDGDDPDANTTLTYSAVGLPPGATLDPSTGAVAWVPSPGQIGDFVVSFTVSDGQISTKRAALIRSSIEPQLPTVTIVLTPSFAPVPGQKVVIHALADSLAEIVSRTVTVDGVPLSLDASNRGEFVPSAPGRYLVEATATDADGLVGFSSTVLKVRDPADTQPPLVVFAAGLDGAQLTAVAGIVATIDDQTLDRWQFELALLGSGNFATLATGNSNVIDDVIAQLDPGAFNNGFYVLRLTATDIDGRTRRTEVLVELSTPTKATQYLRSEIDLTIDLGGVPVDLTRVYDSLGRNVSGSFGFGWKLAGRDVSIQTDVRLTGREALGVFNPFRAGTRLYVTLPDTAGQRVAFTFAPVAQTLNGVTIYTPAWVADAGVDYTLESVERKLIRAGERFYDLKSGRAYNPASAAFGGPEYTLTASDGNIYHISTASGIEEHITPPGARLIYTDNAIVNPVARQLVRLVRDAAGRIDSVVAPDGSRVVYAYDDAGDLVAARNLNTGQSRRYAYSETDAHLLSLALDPTGVASEVITFTPTPQVQPIDADLGSAFQFTARVTNGNLAAGTVARHTLIVRASELLSTSNGTVLIGIEVRRDGVSTVELALPSIAGRTALASHVDADSAFALFAIDTEGLVLIEVAGSNASTAGAYTIAAFVSGDVNRDGLVDGLDGQALTVALGSSTGDPDYVLQADVDRNGVIDTIDSQTLGGNFGFVANRPPQATASSVLTHVELKFEIPLADIAFDPEDDPVFYRFENVQNGTARLNGDGSAVIFSPAPSFKGTAAFDVLADDGFSTSPPVTITVDVSNAPLLAIDLVERNPRLEIGETFQLEAIGNFEDQSDVTLPASYLSYASTNPAVATVSPQGVLTVVSQGHAALSVARQSITAATAVAVGTPPVSDITNLLLTVAGMDVRPAAMTLSSAGGTAQIVVALDGELDFSLGKAANGTLYFVGNSEVVTVGADGLVTVIAEGATQITVINGPAERVITVTVAVPQDGPVTLGAEGGVVRSSDGAEVSVPSDTVEDGTEVSIEVRTESDLPLGMPDPFIFAAAAQLQVGPDPLAQPVDIALPVGPELAEGDPIWFFTPGQLVDASGQFIDGYHQIAIGRVGADGMARSIAGPYPGITRSGLVFATTANGQLPIDLVIEDTGVVGSTSPSATATDEVQVADAQAVGSIALITAIAAGLAAAVGSVAAGVAVSTVLSVALLGGGVAIGLLLFANYLVLAMTADPTEIVVATIPAEGLPTVVVVDAQVEAGRVTRNVVEINNSPTPGSPSSRPSINKASFFFDATHGPVVELEGDRFTFSNAMIGNLVAEFVMPNGDVFKASPLPDSTDTKGRFKVPAKATLGLSLIRVARPRSLSNGGVSTTSFKRSKKITIAVPSEYVFAPLGRDGQVAVIDSAAQVPDPSDPGAFIDNPNRHELVAKINVNAGKPRWAAVTPDSSRVYITLRGSAGIAVLDAQALRQLDAYPDTAALDTINLGSTSLLDLPPGAAPFSITIDPSGSFAYVSDEHLNKVYVIDVNPRRSTYNKIVKHITVDPAPKGLRGIAISSSGNRVYVAAPTRNVFQRAPAAMPGKIISIRTNGTTIASLANKQKLADVDAGDEPYGVFAGDDPLKVVYTNRVQDFQGYGVIKITSGGNFDGDPTTIGLQLGSFLDSFDFNSAQGVVITKDATLGFLLGFNRYIQGVKANDPNLPGPFPAGGNVGIILDPLGLVGAPRLVAATRMIPYSFGGELTLSNDDKFLYAGYRATGAVFVFDVEKIRETLLNPPADANFSEQAIDDINPAIDTRANFRLVEDSDPRTFAYDPDADGDAPIGTGGQVDGLDTQPRQAVGVPKLSGDTGSQLFNKDTQMFSFVIKNDAALSASGSLSKLWVKLRVTGNNTAARRFLDFASGSRFRTIGAFILNPGQERTFDINVRDLEEKLKTATSEINVDRLYGARVKIEVRLGGSSGPTVLEHSMYLYRFLDAADSKHSDEQFEFADTTNDGSAGVVRERAIAYRMPASVQPQAAVDDNANFNLRMDTAGRIAAIKFDPTENKKDITTDLKLKTPAGGPVLNKLKLLGDGFTQQWYVDETRLKKVFEDLSTGAIAGANVTQTTWIDNMTAAGTADPMERQRLVNDIITAAETLLADYTDGLTRVGTNDTNTIAINRFSASTTRISPLADGTLGSAFDVDVVGIVTGAANLLTQRALYSKAEQNFRLSEGLNDTIDGKIDVLVDRYFSASDANGVRFHTTRQQLVNSLAKTFAHEVGHNVGLVHTRNSDGDPIRKPDNSPVPGNDDDVMRQGVDPGGATLFELTDPALAVALGIDYSSDDGQKALDYYAAWVKGANAPGVGTLDAYDGYTLGGAAAADGIDNDFLQVEPFGIGNLNILIGDGLRQAVDVDGGVVAVDGAGGAQSQLVLTLANISETPVMIFDFQVSGPGADQFTVPTIARGTVIGGFETISLPITFDPTRSGSQILDLVFHTDGAVPVVGTRVTAFGLAPDGDLLIEIPNNNVGGQRIDDDSQFIADFATMTNIGENPLTIRMVRVVENDDEFRVSGMPAGFGPSQPLVLAPNESFTVNLEYRIQRLGLQRGIVQFVTDDPDQQIFTFTVVGTGIDSDAPQARLGGDFGAISTDVDQRPTLVRSDAAGDFPMDLPPNTPFELTIFDPETGLVALEINATPDQGVAFDGLTTDFAASVEPDSDGDGLPDDIELAIGSDPHSRDTNRDGIDDFQSIAGNIDPVNPNLSPTSSMTFATSIPATKAAAVPVEASSTDAVITAQNQALSCPIRAA